RGYLRFDLSDGHFQPLGIRHDSTMVYLVDEYCRLLARRAACPQARYPPGKRISAATLGKLVLGRTGPSTIARVLHGDALKTGFGVSHYCHSSLLPVQRN